MKTPKKPKPLRAESVSVEGAFLYHSDVAQMYEHWPAPTCIIADGPYGLGKFPGEPKTVTDLAAWYAPHAAAWYKAARPDCTLWFWSSELAWATVHPILELHGWEYAEACIWDKGIQHIAGNVNSKTIRGMPVATEVAVRYTRKNRLPSADGEPLSLKEWVRAEWQRSGLPMNRSNEACGVKNAATRKYLTQCHLWYYPPVEAMEAMAAYCAEHGKPTDRPYFSLDGQNPFNGELWEQMRAKWNHAHGLFNVWNEPPVHGSSRVKVQDGTGYMHANQKPLRLMELQVKASSDPGDVIWEPFGGLCSATLAATSLGRRAYAAEVHEPYFRAASERLRSELAQRKLHDERAA